MRSTTVDVTGILKSVPNELKAKIRELVGAGKANIQGIYVETGRVVKVELTIPLNEIGEDIAKCLDRFAKGKK